MSPSTASPSTRPRTTAPPPATWPRCFRNPVVTSLAVRFAGDAPTLTSALTTSAYNTGIAAGSALAGQSLGSSLGLTGPSLVGAVFAALTLVPLIALALAGTGSPTRIVAQRAQTAAQASDRTPAATSH
ncbi:hypothetical protein AB0I00_41960 [Streptomyces sp. NPDC050803]|uniref:hypothetical protein n=1 Tax=unclassified Streptomyces TaxID=2593676 RepID=UPI0034347EAA